MGAAGEEVEVEEGEDGGGLETELWLLMSRKLASGGRRRTPERVDPSMAFWSWRKKRGGAGYEGRQRNKE